MFTYTAQLDWMLQEASCGVQCGTPSELVSANNTSHYSGILRESHSV